MAGSSRRAGPRVFTAVLAAGAAVLVLVVRSLGAKAPDWYPPCPFNALTGWYCPGCGSSRTVHLLLHGEWLQAFGYNPLLVLTLPLVAAWAAHAGWRALRHDLPPAGLPRPAAAIALVVFLLFFLLRNLPWWPCTLLAPHG